MKVYVHNKTPSIFPVGQLKRPENKFKSLVCVYYVSITIYFIIAKRES